MKNITLAVLFTLSALLFAAGTGFQLSAGNRTVTPLSCVSWHTLIHGTFTLTARYFFSFYNNRGVVRINGAVLRDEKPIPSAGRYFLPIPVPAMNTLWKAPILKK